MSNLHQHSMETTVYTVNMDLVFHDTAKVFPNIFKKHFFFYIFKNNLM